MATVDENSYLSAVQWSEEAIYFSEFLKKFHEPQVARIVKGQYQHLGVPSLPNPNLSSVVLLGRGTRALKISAQCVKFKNRQRIVPVGPRLSIPENYQGWFEILSEEGRSSRCFESVLELYRRSPDSCLVRENLTVNLAQPNDPNVVSEKTRTLPAGEVLKVGCRVQSASVGKRSKSNNRVSFLRCVTSKSETVYLSLDSLGKFSPLAKKENISGVHSIKNLLTKRFPLMVRLVHGKLPTNVKAIVPEMRFYCIYEEDTIISIPLMTKASPIVIPQSAALKIQVPRNSETLITLPEYKRLAERCRDVVDTPSDTIQVADLFAPNTKTSIMPLIFYSKPNQFLSLADTNREKAILASNDVYQNISELNSGKHASSVNDAHYDEIDQIYDYVRGIAPLPEKVRREANGGVDHHGGFLVKPQPNIHVQPTIHGEAKISERTSPDASKIKDKPPEPPPIETIPNRRFSMVTDPGRYSPEMQMEKDNRGFEARPSVIQLTATHPMKKSFSANRIPAMISNPKLYTRSNNGSHTRIFHKPHFMRQQTRSAAIPLIDNETTNDLSQNKKQRSKSANHKNQGASKSMISTSHIFNIRYKSLTNLATEDYNSNTIESGNSGDRSNSLKSGGSATQSANLRRKSMSNLSLDVDEDVDANNKYNASQNEKRPQNVIRNSNYIDAAENNKLCSNNNVNLNNNNNNNNLSSKINNNVNHNNNNMNISNINAINNSHSNNCSGTLYL